MPPAPLQESEIIIDRLNSFTKQTQINEFDIVKLKRDAEKLGNMSIPIRDMILGMIATLEFNISEMRRRHENSIRLDPGNVDLFGNYAVSLSQLYLYKEAGEYYEKSFRKGLDKPTIKRLTEAIKNYFLAGDFYSASSLSSEFSGLLTSSKENLFIDAAFDVLNRFNTNDQYINNIKNKLDIACTVLREKKLRNLGVAISKESSNGDSWWDLSVLLCTSYADIIDLEDEIDYRIDNSGIHESMNQGYVSINLDSKDDFFEIAKKIDDSNELPDTVELDDSIRKRIEEALR